jgi:hypothetical protein
MAAKSVSGTVSESKREVVMKRLRYGGDKRRRRTAEGFLPAIPAFKDEFPAAGFTRAM